MSAQPPARDQALTAMPNSPPRRAPLRAELVERQGVRLTRRYRFAASHRLHVAALSEEENWRLYGKCNNPYGHGHDYVLEVTVEGPVDESGQVADRAALDRLIQKHVLDRMDHRNLNADLAEFAGRVPTTENLASVIEKSLTEHWTMRARLARLRISETDRNAFELEAAP